MKVLNDKEDQIIVLWIVDIHPVLHQQLQSLKVLLFSLLKLDLQYDNY